MSPTLSSEIPRSPLRTIDPNLQEQPPRSSPPSRSQSKPFADAPSGHQICVRCDDPKPYDQFVRKKSQPFNQENEIRAGSPRNQGLLQTCADCRELLKDRDRKKIQKRRETKDRTLEDSFESYSWEEVMILIDNGYSHSQLY